MAVSDFFFIKDVLIHMYGRRSFFFVSGEIMNVSDPSLLPTKRFLQLYILDIPHHPRISHYCYHICGTRGILCLLNIILLSFILSGVSSVPGNVTHLSFITSGVSFVPKM